MSSDVIYDRLAERARSMRADGATYMEIKAALGVGTSTVSRMLGTTGRGQARPRIPSDVRQRARELRRGGESVPEIGRELGIARSTAWLITKDIAPTPGPDSAARRAAAGRAYWKKQKANREARRQAAHSAWSRWVGELTEREMVLIGAAIYWAEGAKSKPWRRSEAMMFVNSDASMIKAFLCFLDILGVEQARRRVRLQIHESGDLDAALEYWSDVVGVPVDEFGTTTIKRHKPKTNRRNVGASYRGCLVVWIRRSAGEYWAAESIWAAVARAAASLPQQVRRLSAADGTVVSETGDLVCPN
jgi:hypothetical protein